ncbi:MAG: hypothetical protein HOP12_09080 [Candidatus Eisenbacteria bacterium]|uniref:Uncharacterized protein n=1 Tax=Eiseniibacteriota bacterium TaxID=2212470 RepID=A0A849SNA1_UNCEI|nr:hypothetical protein [Candidatus Eisenbacteria bacterium]
MSEFAIPTDELPLAPWEPLREALLARAAAADARGEPTGAELRAVVDQWWQAQELWNADVANRLRVHHDINNALVGVSGNAQLLMMGPAGRTPGVRERLEVVLRESQRIELSARGLRALRVAFAPDPVERRQRGAA